MKNTVKRCAIYTRKSTEEGLEQEFNTLDAQREACMAFIASQKAEGWTALPDYYDDGGFTGGNMDRPALQCLLDDIKAGKVNTVVVYKIDRLTRSLMDFSKLVEIFDQYDVTFVSVTQSFNTTTSMGRLTLNVLLSFAQFEREVIGERVRDKIAASKKKGMWMGGNRPIGYDIVEKRLVPNEEEIPVITMLFERYMALGSVPKLMAELKSNNIRSEPRISLKGNAHGGNSYSRGALYTILTNPVYVGRIRHKNQIYEGQHKPIISDDLWSKVQQNLQMNMAINKAKSKGSSLLQGLLFDEHGTPYSPTHTNKSGKRYRYYVSQNSLQCRDHPDGISMRFPADKIDDLIRTTIAEKFSDSQSAAQLLNMDEIEHRDALKYISTRHYEINIDAIIRSACKKIIFERDSLKITLSVCTIAKCIEAQLKLLVLQTDQEQIFEIVIPYKVSRGRNGVIRINTQNTNLDKDDPFNRPKHEIQNWIKGTAWRDMYFKGKMIEEIAAQENVGVRYVSRLIEGSFI